MQISELFQKLALGELSNLSLADDGKILPAHQKKIIMHANEALLRLYSRFVLKEQELILTLVDGVTNYHLLKRYAVTQADLTKIPYPYINDLMGEPFKEDVIKVLAVFDASNEELPLNDAEDSRSVFTPQVDVLQVPRAGKGGVTGTSLGVSYQAKPEPLTAPDPNAPEPEVPLIVLTEVLHGALTAYIAYRVYTNIGGQDNIGRGQEFLSSYERICQEIMNNDLTSASSSTSNKRFNRNGWI